MHNNYFPCKTFCLCLLSSCSYSGNEASFQPLIFPYCSLRLCGRCDQIRTQKIKVSMILITMHNNYFPCKTFCLCFLSSCSYSGDEASFQPSIFPYCSPPLCGRCDQIRTQKIKVCTILITMLNNYFPSILSVFIMSRPISNCRSDACFSGESMQFRKIEDQKI